MTGRPPDDVLDGLFHACALAAFLEQARVEQGWPGSEATRRRAYRLYEAALAEKNGPPPRTAEEALDTAAEACYPSAGTSTTGDG